MDLNRLKHAVRRLLRAPLFAVMTLVTLAIGIGANTAVFSVIQGILLKPLPFQEPERLVGVWHTAPGLHIDQVNVCPALYFTYRDQNRSFEDFGIWNNNTKNVTGLAVPEQVRSITVTDGVLPALRVRPLLGRTFTRTDDKPGSPWTVVLAYGYWKSHFGADPVAIGRHIMLDGVSHEIIGVLPSSFDFEDMKLDLITPAQFDRNKTFLGNFSYQGVARLKPGVTIEQANADIARLIPIGLHAFPAPPGFSVKLFEDARLGPDVHELKEDVIGDIGKVLWVLMGTIGIVLLIACANVANLMLVRADGRQQELAIRAALGAGWGRIARELLLESVLLGLCGGLLGLALAYGALRILAAVAPANLPRLSEISIDGTVLLFTLGISLLVGLLFGLIPVFKYAGPQLGLTLRAGGRALSQSREWHRARNILVIVQVALALVLLIGSGLMIRTFAAMRNVDPGFVKAEQLQTFRIFIPETEAKEPERAIQMHRQIMERIRAVPGVTAVAATTALPMEGEGWTDLLFAADHTYAEGKMPPLRRFQFVTPGLFSAVGTRLLAGRDFTWNETLGKTPVAIVSENLARELWHEPSAALGKRVRESLTGPWREVIGVVADVRDDGIQKPVPTVVYWPVLLVDFETDKKDEVSARRELAYVVRSAQAGSSGLLTQVQQAVWASDGSLPVANVRTLDQIVRKSMARTSFTLVMLSIAGSMALLLGIVGVYGVISYSVSQRTREIGIRLAVGAQEPEVMRLFVRHGLVLSTIGVLCGLAVAAGVTRLMTSLLFNVSPLDPFTYLAVSLALILGTMAATYLPARKVSMVDPVEALRAE